MMSINLFSFIKSDIWLKSFQNWHKSVICRKIPAYTYTEHFLAVPACYAGIQSIFQKDTELYAYGRTSEAFTDSK